MNYAVLKRRLLLGAIGGLSCNSVTAPSGGTPTSSSPAAQPFERPASSAHVTSGTASKHASEFPAPFPSQPGVVQGDWLADYLERKGHVLPVRVELERK